MIELRLNDHRGVVEPDMFGCLIEHVGTLYDGIWVGDDPAIADDDGLRLDTIEAFEEMGMKFLRFPGGTPADVYRWRDGIGPRAERPRTWNFFFGGEDDHAFGTDEFLRLCERVGATAGIKINPISAPMCEALEWMQYCNYGGDTTLANERRENGRDEPWGVRYWILGNETIDSFSPENYAERVYEWTFFMRQLDPAAKIVAEGFFEDWNERFLKRYSELCAGGYLSKEIARVQAEGPGIQPGGKIQALGLKYPEEKTLKHAIEMIEKYCEPGTMEICVEEWQAQSEFKCGWPDAWREGMSMAEIVLAQGRTNLSYENEARMDGAVSAAKQMHMFMRYAAYVKSACFLYPTNAWTPLLQTRGAELVVTAHGHLLGMLKAHQGGAVVGATEGEGDGVDVLATADDAGGKLVVSLVNEAEGAVDVTVGIGGGAGVIASATATVISGAAGDQNSFAEPGKVTPREGTVAVEGGRLKLACAGMSVTVLGCEVRST